MSLRYLTLRLQGRLAQQIEQQISGVPDSIIRLVTPLADSFLPVLSSKRVLHCTAGPQLELRSASIEPRSVLLQSSFAYT